MWTITKDIINPSCGDKPVLAHSSNWREEKCATAFPFQLRDDDGELYFEGLSTDDSSERAFVPLDEFGAAYGCTTIWYQDAKGVWEQL